MLGQPWSAWMPVPTAPPVTLPLAPPPPSHPEAARGDTGRPAFIARNVAGNWGLLVIQVLPLASSFFNKSEPNHLFF